MAASKNFSHPVDFRYYRHQIRKRLWLVILITLITLIGLGVGVYQALSTLPLYRSTAKLLFEDKGTVANVMPFKDPLDFDGKGRRGGVNTHIKVLRSPALAELVIKALDLESHPEYFARKDPLRDNLRDNVKKLPQSAAARLAAFLTYVQNQFLQGGQAEDATLNQWISGLQQWLQGLQDVGHDPEKTRGMAAAGIGAAKPAAADMSTSNPQQAEPSQSSNEAKPASDKKPANTALLAWLKGRLIIRPDPSASIINISFQSHHPSLTASVANTLANQYVVFSHKMRFDATDQVKNRPSHCAHQKNGTFPKKLI